MPTGGRTWYSDSSATSTSLSGEYLQSTVGGISLGLGASYLRNRIGYRCAIPWAEPDSQPRVCSSFFIWLTSHSRSLTRMEICAWWGLIWGTLQGFLRLFAIWSFLASVMSLVYLLSLRWVIVATALSFRAIGIGCLACQRKTQVGVSGLVAAAPPIPRIPKKMLYK